MAFSNVTEWRKVEQLNEIKTSQKGNPQRGVRTEKGWITVRGAQALLTRISIGCSIEIGNPSEFTNPSTQKTGWYAQLLNVGDPPAPPEPKQQESAPATNGAKPSNGKIPWLEFASFFKATHEMLREVEPDIIEDGESETATGEAYGVKVIKTDRSAARATMMNTCVMAFEHGRIEAPEVDDEGVPF